MTGVDAAAANIKAAEAHRSLDPSLFSRLNYANTTAEALAADGHRYDVVVSSEVIEHVSNVGAFLDAVTALMKVRSTADASRAVTYHSGVPLYFTPYTRCLPPLFARTRAARRSAGHHHAQPHGSLLLAGHRGRRVCVPAGPCWHARVGKIRHARRAAQRAGRARPRVRGADGLGFQPADGAVVHKRQHGGQLWTHCAATA